MASDSASSRKPGRGAGIPLGFERLLHPQNTGTGKKERKSPESPTAPPDQSSRFRLHIRQQPIATRACAAGEKDRRPIDPPPILQMLIVDFDHSSEDDRELLQDSRYVVGCLLYAVQKPGPDGEEKLVHSTHMVENSRRHRESYESRDSHSETSTEQRPRAVQVLSGRTYVSPFYASAEPDPDTAPPYPTSHPGSGRGSPTEIRTMPATFFIFADLSVRTAGTYRLKFRLMNWGMTVETGKAQPILAETLSDPFRVYSSKDFPGMTG